MLLHSDLHNCIHVDTCQECGHVIAIHEYTFEVDEEFQVYVHVYFSLA